MIEISHEDLLFFKCRSRDRLFAGFLLSNIGTSADVEIDICIENNGARDCNHPAGYFAILGGGYCSISFM